MTTGAPTPYPPELRQGSGSGSSGVAGAGGGAGAELFAVADFCLIPMGTGSSSVGAQIAECAEVLETFKPRGLTFKMHGYGTNLEGPWALVSEAIASCHARLHEQGVPRIATDIRIGTKAPHLAGKPDWAAHLGENERKLESVNRRLAGAHISDSSSGSGTATSAVSTGAGRQDVGTGIASAVATGSEDAEAEPTGGYAGRGLRTAEITQEVFKEGAIPARPSIAESNKGQD